MSTRRRPVRRTRRTWTPEILRSPLARWPVAILAVAALATGNLVLTLVLAAVAYLAWP